MAHRHLALLLALTTAAAPALARSSGDADNWCGTTRGSLAAAVGVHDEHERNVPHMPERPVQRPSGSGKSLAGAVTKGADRGGPTGNIAVLTDEGDLFRQPNPVDLDGTGLQFAKQKKGFKVAFVNKPIAGVAGSPLPLGDDASFHYQFPKGFKFPFYGKNYTSVEINSDGNLTFGQGDSLSTDRGLQRFLSGPPRIAPYFTDLNPEQAGEGAGVFVTAAKTALTFTWKEVPEWTPKNDGPPNTFQIVLERNGRITFVYGDLATKEAVTGIAPGDGSGVDLVDFRNEAPVTTVQAIAERFTESDDLDDMAVAQSFFKRFADDYDHVIVWLDFPYVLGGGAFAYEFGVKNDIKGIGQNTFDASGEAGSKGRLRSFVQMGTLSRYPTDPNVLVPRIGTNTTMDVLGQEVGHRWGAFLRYKDPNTGAINSELLGRAFSHWSFMFNSDASDLEGNEIQDQGGGAFRTVDATSGFGPLDLYIMGLIDKSEVPPLWFVRTGDAAAEASPEVGVGFSGERVDITIDDVIAAEGPRVPSAAQAPHEFKMAFILIEQGGQAPSAETLAKMERYRTEWEAYFARTTGGRGSVDTSLRDR